MKCVVIGDGAVGKTSMLMSYTTNIFPTDYIPTIFDNFVGAVNTRERSYELELVDTAGQEDYDSLRPLSYQHTDVFLVCFSVAQRTSYENISAKWISEIKHFHPYTPYILVGTQVDLRGDVAAVRRLGDVGVEPVGVAEGREMAERIRAVGYMECSAKTQLGLRDVFRAAVEAVIEGQGVSRSAPGKKKKKKKRNKGCVVM